MQRHNKFDWAYFQLTDTKVKCMISKSKKQQHLQWKDRGGLENGQKTHPGYFAMNTEYNFAYLYQTHTL